jgi:hypothetical protein
MLAHMCGDAGNDILPKEPDRSKDHGSNDVISRTAGLLLTLVSAKEVSGGLGPWSANLLFTTNGELTGGALQTGPSLTPVGASGGVTNTVVVTPLQLLYPIAMYFFGAPPQQ